MKISLILLILLIPICSFGQGDISYIEYHKNCRKAEKLFLNDSIKECFDIYTNTFEKFEILFPRDCFMASQFAHKSKKDSLAVEYILKGIQFGLNPDFFTKDIIRMYSKNIYYLKNSQYWSKIIKQKDSLFNIYHQKVDWELKSQLMDMIRVDQNWRIKNNKWFNRNFRKGLENKFNIVNKQHLNYLDSVFKDIGYPGNWITGIGDSLSYETNYGSFLNSNLNELPDIILYHNDSVYINYGGFLFNEIDKGHIHPRTYAMIRDFRDRHLVKKDKNENMYYNIWWKRYNYTDEEIEQHCYEIGCPTKQHLRNISNKLGKGYDIFWSPFR
jgi:hypothetical protein